MVLEASFPGLQYRDGLEKRGHWDIQLTSVTKWSVQPGLTLADVGLWHGKLVE